MQRKHLAQQRIGLFEAGQRVRENREQRNDERRRFDRGLTEAEPDHEQRRDRDDRHRLKEHAERQDGASQDRYDEEADRQRHADGETRGESPNNRTEGRLRGAPDFRPQLDGGRIDVARRRQQVGRPPSRRERSLPRRRAARTGRSTPAGGYAGWRSSGLQFSEAPREGTHACR